VHAHLLQRASQAHGHAGQRAAHERVTAGARVVDAPPAPQREGKQDRRTQRVPRSVEEHRAHVLGGQLLRHEGGAPDHRGSEQENIRRQGSQRAPCRGFRLAHRAVSGQRTSREAVMRAPSTPSNVACTTSTRPGPGSLESGTRTV
jgi:hypothetical protein